MKNEWSKIRKNLQNVCFDMLDLRQSISTFPKNTFVSGCGELWIIVGDGEAESVTRFNMVVVIAKAKEKDIADKLLEKTLKEIGI